MVTSKLDSSNTMTICGSLRPEGHAPTVPTFNRSPVAGSASNTPPFVRSTAATAAERGEAKEESEQGGAAARPKRLGPPQHDHHGQRQRHGEAEFFDQTRIDLEEEGERGGVD